MTEWTQEGIHEFGIPQEPIMSWNISTTVWIELIDDYDNDLIDDHDKINI